MYAARHPVAQVVLLVAALAVSIDGVHRIRCCTSPAAPDIAMPRYTGPLIDALEAHHVKHFDADYWIAYRVAFETDERIIGSPRAFKRWPPFDRGRRGRSAPGRGVRQAIGRTPNYHRGLVRPRHRLRPRYDAGDFVVYQPARNVDLETVIAAGRLKPRPDRYNIFCISTTSSQRPNLRPTSRSAPTCSKPHLSWSLIEAS